MSCWYNGKEYEDINEYKYSCRGRGPIKTDDELIDFAKELTNNWYDAGWHKTFTTYYLGDYALSEPKRSLTIDEYNRLKKLQKEAIEKENIEEEEKEWKVVRTECFADNSVEEVWVNKFGEYKRVMVSCPMGDAC